MGRSDSAYVLLLFWVRRPGVAAGDAPDAAHVRGLVEDHHLVVELAEYLGGAEAGEAGANHGDPHGAAFGRLTDGAAHGGDLGGLCRRLSEGSCRYVAR
jgi:hypothetical protein